MCYFVSRFRDAYVLWQSVRPSVRHMCDVVIKGPCLNDVRLPVIMDVEWHVFELRRSYVEVIIGSPVKAIYQTQTSYAILVSLA